MEAVRSDLTRTAQFLNETIHEDAVIGIALGSPVSLDYAEKAPFKFNGTIEQVKKLLNGKTDELVALLTPIVKAFITDNGHIATNACMQVFGGHGFIKEWGMEQFVRDNRINMIYEGTNTIQSLDLLGRKVLGNQGATLKKFGKLVAQLVEEEGVNEKMAEFINPIAGLGDQLTKFTTEIGFKGFQNPDEVGAAAVDYLRVAGHLVFGYFWARMAQVALREIEARIVPVRGVETVPSRMPSAPAEVTMPSRRGNWGNGRL